LLPPSLTLSLNLALFTDDFSPNLDHASVALPIQFRKPRFEKSNSIQALRNVGDDSPKQSAHLDG